MKAEELASEAEAIVARLWKERAGKPEKVQGTENSPQGAEGMEPLPKVSACSSMKEAVQLALEHKIRKIAFPSISTGVYSFPVGLATKIAVNTVAGFLKEHPDDFDLVEWVLFDTHTESVYEAEVDQLYKMI